MKSFKSMQEMARKNPSLNPRVPAYQQIVDKGYGTNDYFFTFTQLKKVGINPTSQHDTPNGIYTFPAKEILEQVHGNMKNVPYVDEAPYIHILKKRGKGIVDPLESYSSSDLKKDKIKIYQLILKNIKDDYIQERMQDLLSEIFHEAERDTMYKSPFGKFWNITRLVSADALVSGTMKWGGVKSKSYKDWYDDKDKWTYEKGKPRHDKSKKIRKHRSDRKGISYDRKGVSYNAQGWNNLLRRLGYNGFVDRSGSGIIHSNEPTQAVFLSSKSFNVVDMIENKSYEVLNRQSNVDVYVDKLVKKHNTVSVVGSMDENNIAQFERLAEGDIRGCHIEFHKGRFYISGDGEISDFSFTGDNVRFDNITIDSGEFFYMKHITDCVIMGGRFLDCEINSCEIVKGVFDRCDFPNIKVINNATLGECKIVDQMVFNCQMDLCRLFDSSIGSGCAVNRTFITGKKGRVILDSDCAYMKCNMNNVTVLKGLFEKCTIENAEIKGGDFVDGKIDYSIIKDGQFRDVKIRLSDVQGGKKV